MAECGQECKDRHGSAVERATKAEGALAEQRTHLSAAAEALGLPATATCGDVVAKVRGLVASEKAAQEALKPLAAAEKRRHEKALKAVVDAELPAALAAAGKEAKQEDVRRALEEDFKAYGSEQLDRHLTTIQRLTATRGGHRDATQFGSEKADHLVGVATAAKVWPRKEAA